MKYRTTQRDVKNGYRYVIGVGYCNLYNLLCRESETAYTTRREGWGADVYDFGNVAIVTGYAPFGNVKPEYDVQKKYDNAAEKIRCDSRLSWDEQKEELRYLIDKFIAEVTE